MRVAVLGGTRFIGVAVVEALVAGDHDVLVVHSGRSEADGQPDVPHAHVDRFDVDRLRETLSEFRAEALVDTCAFSARHAETALSALPVDAFPVVLSSQDVYRAWANLLDDAPPTEALPLTESSPHGLE